MIDSKVGSTNVVVTWSGPLVTLSTCVTKLVLVSDGGGDVSTNNCVVITTGGMVIA